MLQGIVFFVIIQLHVPFLGSISPFVPLKGILPLGKKKRKMQAGTSVGPDQLGLPVYVGSTRIDSDKLGSNKKIKIK